MQPSDLTLLVVLGAADAGPMPLQQLIVVARSFAPYDWQPAAETIRIAAERAVEDGLCRLVPAEGGHTATAFETTPAGRQRIVAVLRKPTEAGGSAFLRACMSVKICFLHYLPSAERQLQAEALAHLYRATLARMRQLRRPPLRFGVARPGDVGHEIVCMESELAWLEALSRWPCLSLAAE